MTDPNVDLLRSEMDRRVAFAPPPPTPARILIVARRQRRRTVATVAAAILLVGSAVPVLVRYASRPAVAPVASPGPTPAASPAPSPTPSGLAASPATVVPRVRGLTIEAALAALARVNCGGTITAIVNSAAPVGQVAAQRTLDDLCPVGLTVSAGPAQSAARCRSLTVTAGQVGAAAGNAGFVMTYRNNGRSPCTLHGYPTVTATDSGTGRTVLGRDSPSSYLGGTQLRVPTLHLRPGDAVSSTVAATDNPGGNALSCTDLLRLRVTVNGQTTLVPRTLSNCSGLQVLPFLPGSTGTAY